MKNSIKLILSILICEFAGVIGSLFTASAIKTWFVTLNKPFFNPPDYIFAPVWISLYALMGISLYFVWNKGINTKKEKTAVKIFFMQLTLNALWSIFFFGLRSPVIAFIDIVLLWILILYTMVYFYKIEKVSCYLLVPYILWVSFASVLNLSIVLLN